ncbi:2-hydroxy-acid oxidase [Roseibium aquae]|uniref:2-hydroxy-acid oxidase n=1 Tax=Roseibium aquae TaxID=1323746 RepID=A0A916TLW7_9HYPH|nr:glycolate oxidase subunit GlcE [Roseibium aquae]GGB52832.1 2-hydroxy-acid oxidase [Roseibium aquae]
MDSILKPRTAIETRDAIAWAAAEDTPLEIVGQGSKRDLGRPVQTAHILDLSDLAGVDVYEPAELVLTLKAGTPLSEVEKLVADQGQELSFEPMDYGPLLGREAGRGTIGGAFATNLSGPRRIKAGAFRDHVLGLEAVSGRGEIFNSGGRVVKNVTGYDLPRALCGSWGTLGVALSMTIKVNPRPEATATFVLEGLSEEQGVEALCKAMGSSAEVSGAAHLPRGLEGGPSQTLIRLEGFGTSVDYRFKTLESLLSSYGKPGRLDTDASGTTWLAIRDVLPFSGRTTPVWRVSVAPAASPAFVRKLRESMDIDVILDWSGGLVWLSCEDGLSHDTQIRRALSETGGGHATLVRADGATRVSVPVFEPQPSPLAALSRRLKDQFDPKGVLNPGRMVAGV